MNLSRRLIILLVAVACIGTWIYHDVTVAQETVIPIPRTQWEYKIMFPTDIAVLAAAPDKPSDVYTTEVEEKGLNKLGAANWELVDVAYLGATTYHYSFKRPKNPK